MTFQPRRHFLVEYRKLSFAAIALLFTAFLLLLLVGLSLPIIKGIYIMEVEGIPQNQPPTSIATRLQFGVWGVCASSVFEHPDIASRCSERKLGYTIPSSITSLLSVPPDILNAVLKALLVVLVLHPIAAALALIALFFSLFLSSHGMTIVALIFTLLSALLTSLVWAADIAIVAVAKANVKTVSGFHFKIHAGPAIWMALVAVICTWAAVLLLSARACYCCGVRKRDLEPDVPVVDAASERE